MPVPLPFLAILAAVIAASNIVESFVVASWVWVAVGVSAAIAFKIADKP